MGIGHTDTVPRGDGWSTSSTYRFSFECLLLPHPALSSPKIGVWGRGPGPVLADAEGRYLTTRRAREETPDGRREDRSPHPVGTEGPMDGVQDETGKDQGD